MPNPKKGTVSDDLLYAVAAKLQQGTMNTLWLIQGVVSRKQSILAVLMMS